MGPLDSIQQGALPARWPHNYLFCNVVTCVPTAAKKITFEGEINEKSNN